MFCLDVHSITPYIFKVNKKKNKCLKKIKIDAASLYLQHLKDDKLFEILIAFLVLLLGKDIYGRYCVSIR